MEIFVDDDEGYLAWLREHPEGYVVNADRRRTPRTSGYTTRLQDDQPRTASGRAWTVTSTKICGRRDELGRWAEGTVGGTPSPCPSCM